MGLITDLKIFNIRTYRNFKRNIFFKSERTISGDVGYMYSKNAEIYKRNSFLSIIPFTQFCGLIIHLFSSNFKIIGKKLTEV